MQMMPATSWTRRVEADWAAAEAELDDIPNPPLDRFAILIAE
jgi:hypothetical protein